MMDSEIAPQKPERHDASNAGRFGEVSQAIWIRVGALGDLLVALAALAETHAKFPNAKIWVMGPPLWLQILKPGLWPRVNGVIVVRGKSTGELFVPERNSWRADSRGEQPLRFFFRQSQASVNHRVESYRYAWGPFLARVRFRFGTCPWFFKWLYTHWSPWLGKDPIIHERDRHLRILEAKETKCFPLGLTQKNRAELKRQQTGSAAKKADKFKVFQENQDQGSLAFKWKTLVLPNIIVPDAGALKEKFRLQAKQYWLINPTSSRWEKAWPKEKFREFADQAMGYAMRSQRELLIVGAPNETEWLNFVANNKIRVIQPKSIDDLANLVAQAELLVTNTSSVQYIAACTKTPTLTLMGRTFPARWGPLGTQDKFLAGRVPPKFKGNIFEEDYAGYDSISVEEAMKALKEFRL